MTTGDVIAQGNAAFRDFNLDGSPASGPFKPQKPAIRQLMQTIATAIDTSGAGGGIVTATVSELFGDLSPGANSKGEVYADPGGDTPGHNGVWKKFGASGTGHWTWLAPLSIVQLQIRVDALDALDIGTRLDNLDANDAYRQEWIGEMPIRPGDAAHLFSDVTVGAPANMAASSLVPVASANGAVLRMLGVATLAARGMCRLEPGRKYYARAAITRHTNTSAPSGAPVQFVAAWFDAAKAPIIPAETVLVTLPNPVVSDGRLVMASVIGTQADPVVNIVAPAGAVYMRTFIRTSAADTATDIEVISQLDVTDSIGDAIAEELVEQAITAATSAQTAAAEALAVVGELSASLWPPNTVSSSGTVLPGSPTAGYRFLNLANNSLYVRNAGNTAWLTVAPLGGEHIYDFATKTHFVFGTSWVRRSPRRILTSEFATVAAAEAFRATATIRELWIDNDWTLTGDVVLAAPQVSIADGVVITLAGNDLTMNQLARCPRYQIFDISGGGTVTLQRMVGYPEWFGAVGDGVIAPNGSGIPAIQDGWTDNYAALTAIGNCGVAEIEFDNKIYVTGQTWVYPVNVNTRGVNKMKSMIAAGAGNMELIYCHPVTRGGTVEIHNISCWGYLDRDPSQSTHKLVQLENLDEAVCENVRCINSQNMSITMVATVARVNKCQVEKSCRDGINVTGSTHMFITNNKTDMVADDAIACHVSSGFNGVFEYTVVVTGNVIQKGFGIKCLGARQTNISNNRLRFYYGHGVYISDAGTEGQTAKWGNTVVGNTFADYIDCTLSPLPFSQSSQAAIFISNPINLGSGGTAVAFRPETYDSTAKVFQTPAPFYNETSPTAAIPYGAAFNNVISCNTITNTIDGVTKFSDAGFGYLWNGTAEVDVPMTSLIYSGLGIRIDGDTENLVMGHNSFYGTGVAFYFNPNTGYRVPVWRNVAAIHNMILRCGSGLVVDHLASASHIDMLWADNEIDLDPMCEDANRAQTAGAPNGKWTDTSLRVRVAFDYAHALGLRIHRNKIKNVNRVEWTNSSLADVKDNQYFWDWTGGFARGIGSIQTPIANDHYFVISDPTNADYGKYSTTPDSAFLRSAAAQPATGMFVAGQFVINNAKAVVTGTVLQGWDRLTNTQVGTEHTVDVDWAPRITAVA